MKKTTWVARDNGKTCKAVLCEKEPLLIGDVFHRAGRSRTMTLQKTFGLRPGQCKKVKGTIEGVE